jgi:hypothetical protein
LDDSSETHETHFQHVIFVNIWCGITDDRLGGLFVLDHYLTAERYLNFLEDHLPDLLENVPLEVR